LLNLANRVNGLSLRSQFHLVLQFCGAAVLRFKQQHGNTFWPERAPQARAARGVKGSQYETMLHCREASACLSRPNGMAGELQTGIPAFTLRPMTNDRKGRL
jgi:hypothetical protein